MAELIVGDCIEELDLYPDNWFDSVITDPPYHLTSITKRFGGENAAPAKHGSDGAFSRASKGFMNLRWDGGDIAQSPALWSQLFRVLKPGGYVAAFSSPRTGHRMACAMEDAGFIMHPFIGWCYASGMPKATNPDKALAARGADPAQWEGWRHGTQAQKPALEPIYIGQKPISEPTMADNLLKWGVGCVNIDGCRVEGGRWPANLMHDGSDEVLALFPHTVSGTGAVKKATAAGHQGNTYGRENRPAGTPNIEYGDAGSAARFYYCAKPSKAEKGDTTHPTVKPLALMRWLCRHFTPPGGHILDPFAGSGTTGRAALDEGFQVTLIEREPKHAAEIPLRVPEVHGV